MQNDFKENYIEQQKRLAAERKARLAKIGMGSESVADKSAQRTAPAAQRRTAPAPAAAQRRSPNTGAAQGTGVSASAQRPAPSSNAAGGVRTPVVAPQSQNGQRRPVQAGQAVQLPREKTAPQATVAQDKPREVQSARPAQPQSGAKSTAPQQRKPAAANASRPARSVSYGGGTYSQRRKPADDENDLFKGELSDNDSRAMMFALTGRAEQPDDGGDVDIINMGRIRAPKKKKEDEKKKSNAGRYVGRSFAALGLALAIVIVFVFSSVALIAHGPSETVRDLLVQSAEQASATKWVPYLFLPGDTVEAIINKSEETVKDIVSIDDYVGDSENEITEDEWVNAKDGMIFKTVSGPTFKAYVLLVKDPSRVFVGTSAESLAGKPYGDDIFHITKFYNAVAAINGGEFPDNGGSGTGHTPIGLTYSKGECVHKDGHTDRTFLGITNDNKLVVNEGMTVERATELGIRDGVSFQKGNTLIQNEGEELIFHYQDGNTGTAQRTGIGQRADGTMILVVTDGRSASSLGATHNDMINLMVSFGAVTAGLLDGGSSSLMYYKDYYNKYDYDYEKLDEYQKLGLVNNYKAFTEPRKIPTFFIVSEE